MDESTAFKAISEIKCNLPIHAKNWNLLFRLSPLTSGIVKNSSETKNNTPYFLLNIIKSRVLIIGKLFSRVFSEMVLRVFIQNMWRICLGSLYGYSYTSECLWSVDYFRVIRSKCKIMQFHQLDGFILLLNPVYWIKGRRFVLWSCVFPVFTFYYKREIYSTGKYSSIVKNRLDI